VIELRSESDRLPPLQKKMEQYIANGARLGLLIDPRKRRVYVYRPNADAITLENPRQVSCEPELPGFILDLDEVW
jgi:Uma2 family endonuclease